MSPRSMYIVVKSLSPQQRQAVIDMGFGPFLQLKTNQLPLKLGYFLVENFKPTKMSVKLKSCHMKFSTKGVNKMLGLPMTGVDLEHVDPCHVTDAMFVAWQNQFPDKKCTNGNYVLHIRNSTQADDLFKLNFIALFVNTFGETEVSGCKLSNIQKIIAVGNISKINWCKFICDCMERSTYKWRPNDKHSYYPGPFPVLMVRHMFIK